MKSGLSACEGILFGNLAAVRFKFNSKVRLQSLMHTVSSILVLCL